MTQQRRALYTVPEAAELLGLGQTKTWALVSEGELGSVLIGRARRVPSHAIRNYISRLEQEQQHDDTQDE